MMDTIYSTLTEDTINQNLRRMEFPWPSPVVSLGNIIEEEIKKSGRSEFPFDEVIHAHAGDPQGMGQKPVTFFQQVIHAHAGDPQGMGQKPVTFFQQTVSLCINPNLLENDYFPMDVKQRATTILRNCEGHTIGSASDYRGMEVVRRQVAQFIQERDDVPADYQDVFLSSGATDAIRVVLYLLNSTSSPKPAGVMIPIPQYPLFSSTVAEYGMYQISYYLDEENQWALDVKELRRAINEARPYCEPKVLVIINPGNPSGFVMSRQDIESTIKFAYEENLFILADEVYQYNVYDPEFQFYSFKKVMSEMGAPYNKMELASFMSASKGYMGECGARSGYCEIVNLDCNVKEMLIQLLASRLCPPLLGQIIMYCITNPPIQGEPSHQLFKTEKNDILESLKLRAQYCYRMFNSVKGLSCNKVIGAMYVYPRIHLTKKAIEEANARNQNPDEFYTMELLKTSGICLIPGCLFGQKPDTYHFRLTFLPQMARLEKIVQRILDFQRKFNEIYRDDS